MTTFLIVLFATLLSSVVSHSWIDCFKVGGTIDRHLLDTTTGENGCVIRRGNKKIDDEYTGVIRTSELAVPTPLCAPADDKRLYFSAVEGDVVSFTYLPNGHIVKNHQGIWTKHSIYWTGEAGTKLVDTSFITDDNLVPGSTSSFDDGVCGESVEWTGPKGTMTKRSSRAGDSIPCISSFVVPSVSSSGYYNMVWYWLMYNSSLEYSELTSFYSGVPYPGSAYSTCFTIYIEKSEDGQSDKVSTNDADTTVDTVVPPIGSYNEDYDGGSYLGSQLSDVKKYLSTNGTYDGKRLHDTNSGYHRECTIGRMGQQCINVANSGLRLVKSTLLESLIVGIFAVVLFG